jgi:DNA-binding response OmpR family regulator
VLVINVVMPGLRGTELVLEIQRLWPQVHVLHIWERAKPARGANAKGCGVFAKPFPLAALTEQLKLVPRKV